MRTINFKLSILLLMLLFGCKAKQPVIHYTGKLYKTSVDIKIEKPPVKADFSGVLTIRNKKNGFTYATLVGPILESSDRYENILLKTEVPAEPGDTISYYLLVGADCSFRHQATVRLENSPSETYGESLISPWFEFRLIKVAE